MTNSDGVYDSGDMSISFARNLYVLCKIFFLMFAASAMSCNVLGVSVILHVAYIVADSIAVVDLPARIFLAAIFLNCYALSSTTDSGFSSFDLIALSKVNAFCIDLDVTAE